MLFVEAQIFTARMGQLLDDETYREMQNELLENPEKGDVMPDCGGLRKVRIEEPRRGKGKRGGCRVIYLHIPEADRIDMVAIYSKSQQDDLTADQRKTLKVLAEHARIEAIRSRHAKGK
jgi:hypothetical protein